MWYSAKTTTWVKWKVTNRLLHFFFCFSVDIGNSNTVISIITIIIIIIKLRKQGCSETTFVTQKAPCLKIIIIGKVSLPLELSPRLEWSLFGISGTAPLIGMFSLSGPTAKKVIRGKSSFALVNYSIAVYWFFEVWLPAGISLKLMSWLCPVLSRGLKDSGINPYVSPNQSASLAFLLQRNNKTIRWISPIGPYIIF